MKYVAVILLLLLCGASYTAIYFCIAALVFEGIAAAIHNRR